MTPIERARAALEGFGNVTEEPILGGVVLVWDGDPLIGVVGDELIARVPDGWETVTGDLGEWVRRAAEVVLAECVERWHAELAAGGPGAPTAMLNLTRHEPDLALVQYLLLDHVDGADANLRQLAVTCLGHVGRMEGEVLPEVVTRLQELLSDPVLGGTAEDALGDIESFSGRSS